MYGSMNVSCHEYSLPLEHPIRRFPRSINLHSSNFCILNASAAFKHRCSVYIFYAALYYFPSAKNSITTFSAHYQAIGTENNPSQSHRIPYLNPQELLNLIANYVSSSSAWFSAYYRTYCPSESKPVHAPRFGATCSRVFKSPTSTMEGKGPKGENVRRGKSHKRRGRSWENFCSRRASTVEGGE